GGVARRDGRHPDRRSYTFPGCRSGRERGCGVLIEGTKTGQPAWLPRFPIWSERRLAGAEQLLDPRDGLFEAVVTCRERQAEVSVARLARCVAGNHRDVRFIEDLRRQLRGIHACLTAIDKAVERALDRRDTHALHRIETVGDELAAPVPGR